MATETTRDPARAAHRGGFRAWVARHRDSLEGYAFVLPFLVAYILFLIYPFGRGVWIAMHDWNLLAVVFNPDAKQMIGFENFREMLWGRGLAWDLPFHRDRLALEKRADQQPRAHQGHRRGAGDGCRRG